jgi:hypothetical protein
VCKNNDDKRLKRKQPEAESLKRNQVRVGFVCVSNFFAFFLSANNSNAKASMAFLDTSLSGYSFYVMGNKWKAIDSFIGGKCR